MRAQGRDVWDNIESAVQQTEQQRRDGEYAA